MIAFHGDMKIKEKYVARVSLHEELDEIVKGQYWEEGKGCAVGCTIHGSDHWDYEMELGIPAWLAKIEDQLFEGMSNDKAKKWPKQFLSAITPGVDLEKVKVPFLCFVLRSTLDKFDHKNNPEVLKAINTVIDLYESGETDPEKYQLARRSAAAAAAYAAAAAAAYAYAADAAAAAAYAYAAAAAAAAYAAADAAAITAARRNAFDSYAAHLLKLLKECK